MLNTCGWRKVIDILSLHKCLGIKIMKQVFHFYFYKNFLFGPGNLNKKGESFFKVIFRENFQRMKNFERREFGNFIEKLWEKL